MDDRTVFLIKTATVQSKSENIMSSKTKSVILKKTIDIKA